MNIIDLMAEAIEQGWSFDRIDKELYPLIKQAQKDRLVGFMLAEEFDGLFKQKKHEPVIGTKTWFDDGKVVTQHLTAKDIYKDPEQPEQEPVAWYHQEEYKTHFTSIPSHDMIENGYWQPLYTTPPQRTWVGLTDEEVSGLWEMAQIFNQPKHFYLLVEAKLKEKNT